MLVLSRKKNERVIIPIGEQLKEAAELVELLIADGVDELPLRARAEAFADSIKGDEAIELVVVEIRRDKVRLGAEAPTFIPIHREEVYDAIKRSEAA